MINEEVLKIIEDGRIIPIQIKANDEETSKYNLENLEALNVIIKALGQELKTGYWIQEEVRGSLQNRCSITRKEIEELKEMIDKQPYSFLLINPKQKEYEKVLRENRINIDICWNVFCEEGKAYFIPYTEVTKPKFFFREDDDMYDKWQKYN